MGLMKSRATLFIRYVNEGVARKRALHSANAEGQESSREVFFAQESWSTWHLTGNSELGAKTLRWR
jgi:hypothetical protein